MAGVVPRVVLKPRRARPFFARHPWLFAGSIAACPEGLAPGAEVAVFSHEGVFIARGLYNPQSAIRVRLYRWEDAELDRDYWKSRLENAIRLRRLLHGEPAADTAERLVFSEGDGLSGLIVDRYGEWLVAQFTSRALTERRTLLVELLQELVTPKGVVIRAERQMAEQEGLAGHEPYAVGGEPPGPIAFREHGVDYLVDIMAGHKTGFYLDQRENRLAVARHAAGRRVLDLFCYTGGFGLTAIKQGGARHVLGIDSSAPSIEQARQNAVQNHLGNARFEAADVFEAATRLRDAGERFGLVIADPPKYARSAQNVDDAARAYLRLNRVAIDLLEPDGILATCSCSGHITPDILGQVLAQAAELTGRELQVIEQRGQAPDHPIAISCLESSYLKCFLCRVV